MYSRRNLIIAAGVVVTCIMGVILYTQWGKSKAKMQASKDTVKTKMSGSSSSKSSSGGGAGGAAASTGGTSATPNKQPKLDANGVPIPHELNDENTDICDMNVQEYENLLDVIKKNDIMESKLKHTTELSNFPLVIKKNEVARYLKFLFKPKMEKAQIYGFGRTDDQQVEMSFKLCVSKIDSKNYQLRINKRVVQNFSSIKQIEIQMKDTNQLLFTINSETSIPLFYMKLQFLVMQSDSSIKYYEGEKKL